MALHEMQLLILRLFLIILVGRRIPTIGRYINNAQTTRNIEKKLLNGILMRLRVKDQNLVFTYKTSCKTLITFLKLRTYFYYTNKSLIS